MGVVLDRTNYGRWKATITSILEAKGVLDVVEGTREAPVPADDGYKAWKKDDALAKVIIITCLDDEHEKFVRACTTSKVMWDVIRQLKESTATPSLSLAAQDFYSLKWEDDMTAAAFLAQVSEVTERLSSLKKKREDWEIIGKVLSQVPARFTGFKQMWNMTKLTAQVTFLDLQTALLAAEADFTSQQAEVRMDMTVCGGLAAGSSGQQTGNRSGRKRQAPGKQCGGQLAKQVTCYGCGEPGHIRRNCPTKQKDKTSGSKPSPGTSLMAGGSASERDSWYGDSCA